MESLVHGLYNGFQCFPLSAFCVFLRLSSLPSSLSSIPSAVRLNISLCLSFWPLHSVFLQRLPLCLLCLPLCLLCLSLSVFLLSVFVCLQLGSNVCGREEYADPDADADAGTDSDAFADGEDIAWEDANDDDDDDDDEHSGKMTNSDDAFARGADEHDEDQDEEPEERRVRAEPPI